MNAAFPTRLPLEMLDGIRDVNFIAFNSRFLERAIKKLPGRANKWFADHVFLISRLLSEQHEPCGFRADAKNSWGGAFVKGAGFTRPRRFLQREHARCSQRGRW